MNPARRNFLKTLFFGGGLVVLGKIFGGSLFRLFGDSEKNGIKLKDVSSNFKVAENEKEITFLDKEGEKVLIIEK